MRLKSPFLGLLRDAPLGYYFVTFAQLYLKYFVQHFCLILLTFFSEYVIIILENKSDKNSIVGDTYEGKDKRSALFSRTDKP